MSSSTTKLLANKRWMLLIASTPSTPAYFRPGAPMIEGREQIKAFWKQAIAGMGLTAAKLTTVNAESAGDGIVEIGRADLTANGQIVTVKYVVHWKQEGGAWKWNVDIWNQNP
jgi:ketosteroid isomerase-like protein